MLALLLSGVFKKLVAQLSAAFASILVSASAPPSEKCPANIRLSSKHTSSGCGIQAVQAHVLRSFSQSDCKDTTFQLNAQTRCFFLKVFYAREPKTNPLPGGMPRKG
jgi:hypothetical protein